MAGVLCSMLGSTTVVQRTARNGVTQNIGTISTTRSKFGSSSYQNSRIIYDRPELSGDWTFEAWTFQTARGNIPTVFADYISFYINSSGFPGYFSGGNFAGSIQVSLNVWNHIAYTRSGTNFRIWVNGNLAGTWTNSVAFPAYSVAGIGGYNNDNSNNWNGWLDEARVSNVERYTAAFTPPTTAFTNDSNTIILYHFEGANGSTTITDDNS